MIWDGEGQPLTEWNEKCIHRVKEIYNDIPFVVLTKKPELFPSGDQFIQWELYEKELWEKFYIRQVGANCFSDFARLLYLSKNPMSLYIERYMQHKEKIN
jgi:hypothetical protein